MRRRDGADCLQMIFKLLIYLMGGETMMAMLMAQRVILEKMTFAEVPSSLQPQVKEILIDSGMGHLAQ